jgi:hypothetical protein
LLIRIGKKGNGMKKVIVFLGILSIILLSSNILIAVPIDSHYTVTTKVTPGVGVWKYDYTVTNNDQGTGSPYGLDFFQIQVPLGATLTNITDPPSYMPGGYWAHGTTTTIDPRFNSSATLKSGFQWLYWAGVNPASVYPAGASASFSVTVNAPAGISQGIVVSYYGSSYQGFEGNFTSPGGAVALPLPLLLLD